MGLSIAERVSMKRRPQVIPLSHRIECALTILQREISCRENWDNVPNRQASLYAYLSHERSYALAREADSAGF